MQSEASEGRHMNEPSRRVLHILLGVGLATLCAGLALLFTSMS